MVLTFLPTQQKWMPKWCCFQMDVIVGVCRTPMWYRGLFSEIQNLRIVNHNELQLLCLQDLKLRCCYVTYMEKGVCRGQLSLINCLIFQVTICIKWCPTSNKYRDYLLRQMVFHFTCCLLESLDRNVVFNWKLQFFWKQTEMGFLPKTSFQLKTTVLLKTTVFVQCGF